MLLAFITWLAALQSPAPVWSIGGQLPDGAGAPHRIVWLTPDAAAEPPRCRITGTSGWRCEGIPPTSAGIVVVITDGGVVSTVIARGSPPEGARQSAWGRLVTLPLIAGEPDDIATAGVTFSAWRPDRSPVRPYTRRFVAVEDASVHVERLGAVAAWVTADAPTPDPGAFLRIDGASIGTLRLASAALARGSPDDVVTMPLQAQTTITGRVEDARGGAVAGADVELYAPLDDEDDRQNSRIGTRSTIRIAVTHADAGGSFAFDRLAAAPYELLASDVEAGRAEVDLREVNAPIVVKLTPPLRAVGRVLSRGVPVAGARVRFVPDADAWAAASDPRALVTPEIFTDLGGRFVLRLPPERSGTVQIIAGGGASTRVAIPGGRKKGDVDIGDIAAPEPIHVTVRLLDGSACDLFAVGPLGSLGLSVVGAMRANGAYWFELPEAGTWNLAAECGGTTRALLPPMLAVQPGAPEQIVDAQIVPDPP
jgi:hypothetical protein